MESLLWYGIFIDIFFDDGRRELIETLIYIFIEFFLLCLKNSLFYLKCWHFRVRVQRFIGVFMNIFTGNF